MAQIQSGNSPDKMIVDPNGNALVRIPSLPDSFITPVMTGIIPAAFAANAMCFAMRHNAGGGKRVLIHDILLEFTVHVAFTTVLDSTRRLNIFRGGSGTATTGGTLVSDMIKLNNLEADSQFNSALSGSMRVSTTAAVAVTGGVNEAGPLGIMPLFETGAAGATKIKRFNFSESGTGPVVLNPGGHLSISAGAVMGAAGTWQLAITPQWTEESI